MVGSGVWVGELRGAGWLLRPCPVVSRLRGNDGEGTR